MTRWIYRAAAVLIGCALLLALTAVWVTDGMSLDGRLYGTAVVLFLAATVLLIARP